MLAVGGHMLDEVGEQSVRMATGFSGGLGDTREELCGALSGGVMVIGAMVGRESLEEDDHPALALSRRYRARFLEVFGSTQCARLRETVVGAPGEPDSCGDLVERAARILLGLLSEA